jgi:hypothetical protein
MAASHLLALGFMLTAYGTDLGPPLGISSASASEVPTNVFAYQTTQSTAKVIASLAGFTERPVSPVKSFLRGFAPLTPSLVTRAACGVRLVPPAA